MNESAGKPDLVVITAKRLDSDEFSEESIEVQAPRSEPAMREQLASLVDALHPNAEFRSFANEAATFLAPKLLVVAVYRRSEEPVLADVPDDDSQQQQQLFAA